LHVQVINEDKEENGSQHRGRILFFVWLYK
jgi:hypothetical protein